MRYAEDMPQEQQAGFRRVVMTRDYHKLTGPYALKGATGYVTCDDDGRVDVVFERASADRVVSDMVGQCGLTRIETHCLRDAPA